MMRVIIDCNVWISFLLGFQKELIHDVLTNEHIDVYVCPQLIREIREVAGRPKIQDRIGEGDLEQLFRLIKAYCINTTIFQQAVVSIRDSKDLYLLSFAESVDADYIISGDKDLTDLEKHRNTNILSPAQFRLIM